MTRGTGPLILVTGATDGIGRETARELTRRGARVIAHGRSPEKAAATGEELAAIAGAPPPAPLLGDLASLAAVRAMAAELERRGEQPEVLLLNAGVFERTLQKTVDGFERTFAINHLAPFVLTQSILRGPASARLKRIVVVSSMAHQRGAIRLDDPQRLRPAYDAYGAYAASKLANVLFAFELARRVAERGISVNALHPGVVSTKLLTEGFGMQGGETEAEGAATSVMLALEPIGGQVSGRYFSHRREAQASQVAHDRELARKFYELTAQLVGEAPLSG